MKFLRFSLLIVFAATLVFFLNNAALAQETGQNPPLPLPNPLCPAGSTNCPNTIPEVIDKIINFLIIIAAPLVAGMIIYGGFQMLFAQGDPEKFSTGRKTILYAVIGYAIIWLSSGVTAIIKDLIK